MNPRQRQQMGQVADLMAEGSEWWREAADALTEAIPGLTKARDTLRAERAREDVAAQLDTSLAGLMAQVKKLAANFDGMADRFAEAAAGLQSYRQGKPKRPHEL